VANALTAKAEVSDDVATRAPTTWVNTQLSDKASLVDLTVKADTTYTSTMDNAIDAATTLI
jgi:hypothetical protein